MRNTPARRGGGYVLFIFIDVLLTYLMLHNTPSGVVAVGDTFTFIDVAHAERLLQCHDVFCCNAGWGLLASLPACVPACMFAGLHAC